VDTGVLYLATQFLHLDPYTGRVISFLCAASASWLGNRLFTFRDRHQMTLGKQWLAFVLVSAGGFVLNYGTYALLITYVPVIRNWPIEGWPVLGVAAGAIAGMFFNFSVASRLVFPQLEKIKTRAI
jgi:putative flippase GtrA